MSIRYPNANYPQAYDEAEMVTAPDVPVNTAADNLTVTEAGAGQGPLMETATTGKDVRGVTLHDSGEPTPAAKPASPEPEVPADDDL